jgi:sideroflexin-5
MNYGNRNASSSYDVSDLAKGYSAALVSSILIALYTRRIFAPTLKNLQGPSLTFTNSILNYVAGAVAGTANLVFMRYKELSDGIKVQSLNSDTTYGNSKVAAKKAITQTAISRVFLPLPVLFFPALGQFLLTKLRIWPRNIIISKFFELVLCAISLGVALPMSLAIFQQRGMITRDEIEENMREIKNE